MTQLLDTNVWLALALDKHPGHPIAEAWFIDQGAEPESLIFCRSTEQSLLRLLSSQKILNAMGSQMLSNEQAIDAVAKMQRHPSVTSKAEPLNTRSIWLRLATRPTPSPKLWMDAYLAAFAITGGHQMVTFDKAFRQFQPQGLELMLLG
jgi:toxin-antitoxin system PIN domain toxin